jgi:hypothetical protein
MGAELGYIHHVGHVVEDMSEALKIYRKLGFTCALPSYPVIATGPTPEPLGVANTHATFARNFIELVTVVAKDAIIPDGAKLVPLQVPPAMLERIVNTIRRTIATISACLSRFEGLHILVFQTSDVKASAAQFEKDGVRHSGANVVQRQIDTTDGVRMVPVHALEIDGEPVPEGRLAIAENAPVDILRIQSHMNHPNGALDLVGAVLCVPDPELDVYVSRYQRYLGRPARADGATRVFDMERSQVTLVPVSNLSSFLPRETAPAPPAFVAYAVAVEDLDATKKLLAGNGLLVAKTTSGDLFVPAKSALGAAVIFRQCDNTAR